MLATTDEVDVRMTEDLAMPSIWVIAAGLVGAINVRLVAPGIAAFFGVGKYS